MKTYKKHGKGDFQHVCAQLPNAGWSIQQEEREREDREREKKKPHWSWILNHRGAISRPKLAHN